MVIIMKNGKLIFTTQILVSLLMLSLFTIASPIAQSQTPLSKDMRIVSAGGSVTEILYALGMKPQIVAADTSSMYPQSVSTLPKIGYYRQLSVEGVLAMRPTHLYAALGVGPEQVLAQLRNAGVKVHVFEQARTVTGLIKQIREIGEHTNASEEAERLVLTVNNQLSTIKKLSAHHQQRAVFLMSASERGIMAAGRNTVPNLIMDIVGLRNPYDNIEGFKPVSIESFLAIAPTQVLIAAHRTGGLSAQEMCQQPALAQWASMQGCNLHIVDALLFLGLTPRLPEAVAQFTSIVEP